MVIAYTQTLAAGLLLQTLYHSERTRRLLPGASRRLFCVFLHFQGAKRCCVAEKVEICEKRTV
jgi:hypothetical protein